MLLIYLHMCLVSEPVLAALPQPLEELAQGEQANPPIAVIHLGADIQYFSESPLRC